MLESAKTRTRVTHAAIHLVLTATSLLFLLPIAYTISVSLKSSNSLISSTFMLIPQNPTLNNYSAFLLDKPFFLWMKNSLILTVSTVIVALTISSPAAYAYSRFKFKAKRGILFFFLLLNAFPAILSMTAIYRLFRTLNLMNTFIGLILVYTGSMIIFGIWNLKGYFDSIPPEIEQAAMIDGASNMATLIRIVIPLARPAMIVTGMMIFITTWNEYIYAVNFLSSANNYTLAAGLFSLQGTDYTRNWPIFAAGALTVSFPVLVIFFMIQKYLVSGLTAGGIKY
jgi:ABC-type maltose transport system permease subunit